jgi:hypothetical protein
VLASGLTISDHTAPAVRPHMPVTLGSLSQVPAPSHTHHLPAGQQRVADELARPDGNTHEIRQAKLRPLLAGAAGLSVSFFGGLGRFRSGTVRFAIGPSNAAKYARVCLVLQNKAGAAQREAAAHAHLLLHSIY